RAAEQRVAPAPQLEPAALQLRILGERQQHQARRVAAARWGKRLAQRLPPLPRALQLVAPLPEAARGEHTLVALELVELVPGFHRDRRRSDQALRLDAG